MTKLKAFCLVALAAPPLFSIVDAEESKQIPTVTEEMLFEHDPKQWAKPKAVVPPKYPAELLAAKLGGVVDVTVNYNEQGDVVNAEIAKSEPKRRELESAVMDVVRYWYFHVPLSKDCMPIGGKANARVWFEPEGEGGKISVSGNASEFAISAPIPRRSRLINPKEAYAKLKYPIAAASMGIQANVYVIARVDGRQGKISNVTITKEDHMPSADVHIRAASVRAVRNAVDEWRFEPGESTDYRVCIPFYFRFN